MIATGGTIASQQSTSGLKPMLTSEELLKFIPNVTQFCQVDTLQLMNIDSTNIEPKHWLQIANAIETNYNLYDAFVICHGTDTLAYTAAALSYLIQNSKKPIVVTGAQKPIDLEITDAKGNLINSLRFACHDDAHGVVIVFDGKVIAGTRGKKERSKSYNAFSSINFPYLAILLEEQIIFYINDKYTITKEVSFYQQLNPKIALIKLIPSLDPGILDYMWEHYDALIIESFGVGGLPTYETGDFAHAIKRWIDADKPVVMTTQVTKEGSNMSIYEVGQNIKKNYDLLEAYDMTLEATITKLMWILGQTHCLKEINHLFHQTINKDLLHT